jgi:hypothetical protein
MLAVKSARAWSWTRATSLTNACNAGSDTSCAFPAKSRVTGIGRSAGAVSRALRISSRSYCSGADPVTGDVALREDLSRAWVAGLSNDSIVGGVASTVTIPATCSG